MTRPACPASSQQGAALLAALLTVSLVAAMVTAAVWQQWRVTQIETLDRERQQAHWLLMGAFDWARVILREDARASHQAVEVDHLAEPWALPLQEARLSDFLAANSPSNAISANEDRLMQTVFLSGRIEDEQGKLNVTNLMLGESLNPLVVRNFAKLFELLGLTPEELNALLQGWQNSHGKQATQVAPQTFEQLAWLGLSARTLQMLQHHVSVLPQGSALNVNTASVQALAASVNGLSLNEAEQLVAQRAKRHWSSLEDFSSASGRKVTADTHSVNSQFFLARGQLRMSSLQLREEMLMQRIGQDVRIVRLRQMPTSLQ